MKNLLCVDFGSGYNARPGFKTCDITTNPLLDYRYDGNNCIEGLDHDTVDVFYMRNVVHHIEDLKRVFNCIKRYLKLYGVLIVVDCRKEYFQANYFLDKVWYRHVNQTNMYISPQYRDYISILTDIGFVVNSYNTKNEKEKVVLTLKRKGGNYGVNQAFS